jgi:hypothetical protein
MECAGARTRLKFMGRISLEHVASAVRKVRSMTIPQKAAVLDEIQLKQPNLLASCVVQVRLGADEQTMEFLLNLLLTCYVSMRESGYNWPLISETDQERELRRTVGAVLFSEQLGNPTAANEARAQYLSAHPEQPLLALALSECNGWLQSLAQRRIVKESDKYVMMASVNLVNCIAHSEAHRAARER